MLVRRIFPPLLLAGASLAFAAREWTDLNGNSFSADPVEALGPLLLFRAGPVSTQSVPMHALSAADCVRFHEAVAGRPARAPRWSEAQGEASREFIGNLTVFHPWQGALHPFDFASVPEPELLLVLFGGNSLELRLDDLVPFTTRVQRVNPDRLACVVLPQPVDPRIQSGGRNAAGRPPSSHQWLLASPRQQSGMKLVSRFAPSEPTDGFSIMLMTRHGIPLFAGPVNEPDEVMAAVDRMSDLLWQLNPANPRSARARLHYLRAVRPAAYARSQADPLLLIDPFRLDVLRERGVSRIEATLAIAADGAVTQVELLPATQVPAPLLAPVADTLRQAVFLPAIAQGAAIPGVARYTLPVEALDPQLAADAAWVKGEARIDVPLASWLVLKPIRVGEKVFSTVDRVMPDGTVLLKPITAGSPGVSATAEINAFVSDWFAAEGPASVRPREGDKQEVDGQKLVWQRMASAHGLVDLLAGASYRSHDYCVGYACAEFESARDTDGWLGIGSDDGLRVWFNGELVDDKWISRRSRLDDDVVPVRVKKGHNQILVKVQNHTRDWSFTCRLRVRDN